MSRISSSAMLSEAADRMRVRHAGSLAVVEDNEVIGRIHDGDIARAVAAGLDPRITPVKHVMEDTRGQIHLVEP